MTAVHRAAATGFERSAAAYARGRPDYPEALDDWLRRDLALGPGRVVVDLGAGTGKFVPRIASTGATAIAVEPVGAMRAELAARHPSVDVRAGTADAIPLGDAEVDAVVCAQAFHWFATAAATAEIARVLKPGGFLGLVWNVRDESVPWVARLTEIVTPYEGDAPRFHTGAWRRAFPAPGFDPLEETRFAHAHVGPPDVVIVERFLSVSFIASLPPDERARVERELRDLIAAEPALAGREQVAFPYASVAYRARRTEG